MNQSLANRLARLESHLKAENPVLLEVLPTYYMFDKVLRRMIRYGWRPRKDRVLIEFLNRHMRDFAEGLQDRGLLEAVPQPLPVLRPAA